MSRAPDVSQPPGPECFCGAELREVPLPADLAALSGQETIFVHAGSGDTRCYPDDPACTAEPAETGP